jgi:hypothetical protein
MTSLRMLVGIGLIVLGSCVGHPQSESRSIQSVAHVHSGPLQLTLTQVQDPSRPGFLVKFTNVGKHPLILSLGFTFAKEYPDAVHLFLTDAQGKTLLLDLSGPGVIGGIASPYVVHLSAGEIYALPIDLKDYIVHHIAHKEVIWVSDLPSGYYTLKAEYTGLDAFHQPVDHPVRRAALTPYWTGTVISNTSAFTFTQVMVRLHGQ